MAMDSKEYSHLSKVLAELIFRAYGKDPATYDDLEESVIGAFVFGAHSAFSRFQEIPEWQQKIGMYEVLLDEFGFDYETAGNALDFFVECRDTEGFNKALNIVIQCGEKGFDLLEDLEELGRQIKEIVFVMGEKLEVSDMDD
jgi:hypothetical protein